MPFAYGALTHCGATFQNASTRHQICNSVEGLVPLLSGPTTPNWQRHQALPPARFRLFPFRSPLLRESLLLSFPRGTEMFQFPRFPLPALCVQTGVTPHDGCRVSPFGHPRIKAWSAAPRGFSQPPTSFIGSQTPRHPPLALCSLEEQRCSCSLCNSQGARRDRHERREARSARPARKQRSVASSDGSDALPQNGTEDRDSPTPAPHGRSKPTTDGEDGTADSQ